MTADPAWLQLSQEPGCFLKQCRVSGSCQQDIVSLQHKILRGQLVMVFPPHRGNCQTGR
ncbi:hypothetical protein D3C72_1414350 [compost metagenome]